jgi:hypothetical protein
MFLKKRGFDYDINQRVNSLLGTIINDGDINYFGRGTNQIFAWGYWFYLISSISNIEDSVYYDKVVESYKFFDDRISNTIENSNIFLNDYEGKDKYLWWDYHYESVYLSNLFFWLTMSIKGENDRKTLKTSQVFYSDSGIQKINLKNFEVTLFKGRKKYLAEKGPIITSLSYSNFGVIYKGSFGPWNDTFGKKYSVNSITLRNFFGLLEVRTDKMLKSKILGKIKSSFNIKSYERVRPIFVNVQVGENEKFYTLTFSLNKKKHVVLNFPCMITNIDINSISLYNSEGKINLTRLGYFYNQYQLITWYQSRAIYCDELTLTLKK